MTETVWAKRQSGTDRRNVYHTDADCRYVTGDHNEWDRDEAEAWGYSECLACQGEVGRPSGDHSTYQLLCHIGEVQRGDVDV